MFLWLCLIEWKTSKCLLLGRHGLSLWSLSHKIWGRNCKGSKIYKQWLRPFVAFMSIMFCICFVFTCALGCICLHICILYVVFLVVAKVNIIRVMFGVHCDHICLLQYVTTAAFLSSCTLYNHMTIDFLWCADASLCFFFFYQMCKWH